MSLCNYVNIIEFRNENNLFAIGSEIPFPFLFPSSKSHTAMQLADLAHEFAFILRAPLKVILKCLCTLNLSLV